MKAMAGLSFSHVFFPQGSLLTNYGLPIYLDAKLSSSVFGNDSPKLQPNHIRNAPWSILWPSPPLSSPLVSYFPTAGKTLKVSPAPQCFSDLRSRVSHHPMWSPETPKFPGCFFVNEIPCRVAAALACNYWKTIHQHARTHTQYSIYISIGCFCQEWNCKYLDSWKVIFTLTNYLKWPEFYSHHVIIVFKNQSFKLHIQ